LTHLYYFPIPYNMGRKVSDVTQWLSACKCVGGLINLKVMCHFDCA
jgi:hypothetical protein